MYKLIVLTLLSILFQKNTTTISPDGKFELTIEIKGESDLQKRYIATLTSNASKETRVIVNCVRRDLSAPNFYWDKESRFLIYEQCSESFRHSKIKIFNLQTMETDFELTGIIGNRDNDQQQFDSDNCILIYFDTSGPDYGEIPGLYTFDLKTKKRKKIYEFGAGMDMEFPQIKRTVGKRLIEVSYTDFPAGEHTIKQIGY